jgi:hypothetical protein
MLAPSVLGIVSAAAHSDYLVGTLIVTVAVIALANVGRTLRFLNILFGAWVIAAPVDLRRSHACVEVERRDRRGAGDPAEPAARPGGRALRHVGAFRRT